MMHGIHTLNLVFFQGVFLGVFREVVGGGGCFFFYKGEKATFGSFRVFLGQFESQVWGSPPPAPPPPIQCMMEFLQKIMHFALLYCQLYKNCIQ